MRLAWLAFIAIAFAGSANAQQLIKNEEYGFTIQIPDDWQVASNELLEKANESVPPPAGRSIAI